MYKWPKEFDFKVLVGSVVNSVTYTVNSISLVMNEDCVLTSEYRIVHTHEGVQEVVNVPAGKNGLCTIVGKRLTSCKLNNDRTSLTLCLEDGSWVTFDGDDESYECYQLSFNGVDVVI
ncbi:MAG: hypothetical protein FGM32_10955 [Candidatus Kapabacteria bacterium]|nr:hypothetical protein [Candidatus Kapabacteria bacterium]